MATDARASSLAQVVDRLREVLFGMALVCVTQAPVLPQATVLGTVVEGAQMLAFALHRASPMPWDADDAVAPLSSVLDAFALQRADRTIGADSFRALMGIVLGWVALFAALAALVGWNQVRSVPQNSVMVRLLGVMGRLSTSIFFLPVAGVLFRVPMCPDEHAGWMGTTWACGGDGHIALSVIAVLALLVIFLPLAFFFASTVLDRNPSSDSPAARSHGRVDVALLAIRTLLAFLYAVVDSALLGTIILGVLLLAVGAAWIALCLLLLPFVSSRMSALQVGLASGFTICALAFLLHVADEDRDVTYIVYIGAPLGGFLGAAVATLWEIRIASAPLESLHELHYIDLWARHRLKRLAELDIRSFTDFDALLANTSVASFSGDASGAGGRGSDGSPLNVGASAAGHSVGHRVAAHADIDVAIAGSDRRHRRGGRGGGGGRFADSDGLSLRETVVRLLDEADSAYRYAMDSFPRSELACLFAASYFRTHSRHHISEAIALSSTRKCAPSLDTLFYVHLRTTQLRDAVRLGAKGSDRDVTGLGAHDDSLLGGGEHMDRSTVDQQLREIQSQRVEAFRHQVLIWETLAQRIPDLNQLRTVGLELQNLVKRIDTLFQQLLRSNVESSGIMRSYASFLLDLANEPARATELLNRADRIEEMHSKQRSRMVRHIVFGAEMALQDAREERSASITVSADPSSLGEILSVSVAVCRVFGFSSSQLVGQNAAVLLPPPLRNNSGATFHRLINSSHALRNLGHPMMGFGLARGGSIFPLLAEVTEAAPEPTTCAPRFNVVLQPVSTDENHILFGTAETGYRIFAASQRSLILLGLEASVVMEESASLVQWLPSLAASFRDETIVLPDAQVARMRASPVFADLLARWTNGTMGVSALQPGAAHASVGHEDNDAVSVDGDTHALSPSHARSNSMALDSARAAGFGSPISIAGQGRRRIRDSGSVTGGGASSRSLAATGAALTSARITIKPLLAAKTTSPIPISNSAEDVTLLAGSVQFVELEGVEPFFMLRWRAVPSGESEFLDRFGQRQTRRHSTTHAHALSSDDSRSDRGLDDSLDGQGSEGGADEGEGGESVDSDGPAASSDGDEAPVAPQGGAQRSEKSSHRRRHHRHRRHRRHRDGSRRGDTGDEVVELGAESSEGDEETDKGGKDDEVVEEEDDDDGVEALLNQSETDVTTDAEKRDKKKERKEKREKKDKKDKKERKEKRRRRRRDAASEDEGDGVGVDSTSPVSADSVDESAVVGVSEIMPHTSSTASTNPAKSSIVSQSHRGKVLQDSSVVTGSQLQVQLRTKDSSVPTSGSLGGGVGVGGSGGGGSFERFGGKSGVGAAAAAAGAGVGVGSPQWGSSQPANSRRGRHVSLAHEERENTTDKIEKRVGDGHESSVMSSGSKIGAQLRRAVLQQDTRTEREVRWSRLVLLGILLAVLAMLIATILWTSDVRSQVVDEAFVLFSSGVRLLTFQSFVVRMRLVVANNAGFGDLASPNATMRLLLNDADLFQNTHAFVSGYASEHPSETTDFDLNSPIPVTEVSLTPGVPARTLGMPLAESGEYMAALMVKVARSASTDVHNRNRDVANLFANRPAMRDAMNRSIQIRQKEFVELFPDFQLELLVAGIVLFVTLVIIAGALFIAAVQRLGRRTQRVLELFLVVPGPLARAMKERASFLLNRAVVTEAVDVGDGEEEGGEGKGAHVGGGGDDDDEEDRMLLQEDAGNPEVNDQRLTAMIHAIGQQQRERERVFNLRVGDGVSRGGGGGSDGNQGHYVPPPVRVHEDSSQFVCRNVTKLLLPLGAIAFWILFLLLFLMSAASTSRNTAQRMVKMQEAHVLLIDYIDYMWELVETEPGDKRSRILSQIGEAERQILARSKLVVFGGQTVTSAGVEVNLPALETHRLSHTTFLSNACVHSVEPGCETVEDRVLTNGLYSAFMTQVALGRKLLATIVQNDTQSLINPERMDLIERMTTLEFPFMLGLFRITARSFSNEQAAEYDADISVAVNVSTAIVVAIMVFSLMYYLRIINSLAFPIRSARNLLTVLPDEMVLHLPDLRRRIQDLVVEAQLGISTRDHGETLARQRAAAGTRWWATCCGCRKAKPLASHASHYTIHDSDATAGNAMLDDETHAVGVGAAGGAAQGSPVHVFSVRSGMAPALGSPLRTG